MYRDKDKQREAQRERVRQKRATKGSIEQGSTIFIDTVSDGVPATPNKALDIKPKRGAENH